MAKLPLDGIRVLDSTYVFALPYSTCASRHNLDVYCERLGYSKGDLVSMRQLGIA